MESGVVRNSRVAREVIGYSFIKWPRRGPSRCWVEAAGPVLFAVSDNSRMEILGCDILPVEVAPCDRKTYLELCAACQHSLETDTDTLNNGQQHCTTNGTVSCSLVTTSYG